MATEPKTVRETSIVIQGVVDRLDLVQKMTWGVIGLLGALITGAAALYFQLGDIRTDVAVLKSNLGTLKEQQSAIQESLRSIDTKTQASLSRIENRLATNPTPPGPVPDELLLKLADNEVDLLREVLKPPKTGKPPEAKVGDSVPDSAVPRLLPTFIVQKIPRLASYSYAYDASGALLLVSNRTRKVVEIIEPA